MLWDQWGPDCGAASSLLYTNFYLRPRLNHAGILNPVIIPNPLDDRLDVFVIGVLLAHVPKRFTAVNNPLKR